MNGNGEANHNGTEVKDNHKKTYPENEKEEDGQIEPDVENPISTIQDSQANHNGTEVKDNHKKTYPENEKHPGDGEIEPDVENPISTIHDSQQQPSNNEAEQIPVKSIVPEAVDQQQQQLPTPSPPPSPPPPHNPSPTNKIPEQPPPQQHPSPTQHPQVHLPLISTILNLDGTYANHSGRHLITTTILRDEPTTSSLESGHHHHHHHGHHPYRHSPTHDTTDGHQSDPTRSDDDGASHLARSEGGSGSFSKSSRFIISPRGRAASGAALSSRSRADSFPLRNAGMMRSGDAMPLLPDDTPVPTPVEAWNGWDDDTDNNKEEDPPEIVVPVYREMSQRGDLLHRKSKRRICTCCQITEDDRGTFKYTAYLSFLTLGTVFGDIGTSPLYTFTAIFGATPPYNTTPDQIIGALSVMIWSLLVIVLFKYVCFVLMANDYGEGGTFAIYSVLSRAMRSKVRDEARFRRLNTIFSTLALVGVSCVLADGILTPAISVLGAVAGLEIASDAVGPQAVIGISAIIIILLFLPQRWGTSRVSMIFSPIMLLWFVSLFSIGVYNITLYPGVLVAFNPAYCFNFFVTQGIDGWILLGSVFLTCTGSEAMFADLGHFTISSIRLSAIMLVLPSLLMTYCGQAAVLILRPSAIQNTFFLSLPDAIFYPMLVLATLAAIIASQAMISATFSMVAQAMRLNLMPRLTVKHTSELHIGQVYVPEISMFYMVVIIIIIAGFQNATALGYAYGIAVCGDFLITTTFYSLVIVWHFGRHWTVGLLFFCWFGLVDSAFLTSNLLKFTSGGWFSVTMSLFFFTVLAMWRWGRSRMLHEQSKMSTPETELFHVNDPITHQPVPVTNILPNSLLICYASNAKVIPATYTHFFKRYPVRPQNVVFLTVKAVNVANVNCTITITPIAGRTDAWRALVNYGYVQKIPSAVELSVVLARFLENAMPPHINPFTATDEEVLLWSNPTFLVGHDQVVSKPGTGWRHRIMVDLYETLLLVSRSLVDALQLPPERALSVGISVPI